MELDSCGGGGGGFGDGIFQGVANLLFNGNWGQDDPLQLYWYPTLNSGSGLPGGGTSFGEYRHATGLDGSAAWSTPGDGSTIGSAFFTADAAFLNAGGANPADSGRASLTVVPEPASYAAVTGIILVGFAALRAFRRPGQGRWSLK